MSGELTDLGGRGLKELSGGTRTYKTSGQPDF
jgi:hypothetical protein